MGIWTRARTAILVFAVAGAAAVGAGVGCGSGSKGAGFGGDSGSPADAIADTMANDGALAGLESITVSPASANLIAGDSPTSQTFSAEGKFKDGKTRDITNLVAWSATPSMLLAAANNKVSPTGKLGGYGQIAAFAGSVTGTADVSVKLVMGVLEPGAASGSSSMFTGTATAALAPTIAYPLGGALVPPNLQTMEFQWAPAAGTTLFDWRFVGKTIDIDLYTPCNAIGTTGGCGLVPDAATWASLVNTLQGDDAVTVTLVAVGSTAGQFGTSAGQSLQFASTGIQGGLYYFNTRGLTMADGGVTPPGIFRFDFDMGVGGSFFSQGDCAGCHALSLDGTKMLAAICTTDRGCGRPLQLANVDVATVDASLPAMPVGDSDTEAWTPDNKYYVTTPSCGTISTTAPNACNDYSGGVLNLIDAKTNTLVGTIPTGPGALFPAFSNDGKTLVYARGNPYQGPLSMLASSLYTLDFTETPTPKWGTEKPLLMSAGENNYYPSFSPDGKWVLFARSQCMMGESTADCDTYDDPGARAVVMPAAGGTAIDLATANATGDLDNSWPKWSPFAGSYKAGSILWFTMSSVRDYGFRVTTTGGNHVRQLWIVGFDPAKAKAGKDPSFAPVWLPFQDISSSNHIGQWTEKVVTAPK
jgi:WD40-like Beta Propeller Repeat